MKSLFTLIALMLTISPLFSQVFINELHYDNQGTDADEGFEVAGLAGTDLSCYKAFFYNGTNGLLYDSLDLSGTIDDEGVGYGAVWFAKEGIQNGAPDAMGIVNYCTGAPFIPVHFISYEGAIVASGGPFDGMTSEDIGVAQDNTTLVGNSLQLIGTGQDVSDFLWTGPVADSRGFINVDQSFGMAANPSVGWSGTSTQTVSEDVGSVFLQLDIAASDGNDTEILTTSIFGDASVGFDYEITSMPTLFSGTVTTLMWELTILDDTDEELSETIEITILTVSNDANIINALATVTIEDNDSPILPPPAYDIASVTTENADGIADSLQVECELTGIVTTQNFRPDGQQFYMQDATGGINVFSFSETLGYVTEIGDEVKVTGVIDQYNGLTEIIPTAIEVLSQGNTISPVDISGMDDNNEGQLVRYSNLTIVNTADWLGDGSSYNINFTDENVNTVIVRVDNDSELSDMVPIGLENPVNIIGVVGQFDSSSPYTEEYQLFPRLVSDVEVPTNVNELTIEILNLMPNPVSDLLSISSSENFEHVEIYSQDGKLILAFDFQSSIELNELSNGVYILRAINDEKTVVRRFVKE